MLCIPSGYIVVDIVASDIAEGIRWSFGGASDHELQASVAVQTAIFLDAPMKLPWASKVLMTDSGPEGGAVISTEATVPEVRAEARYAESRGWSVALHRITTRDGVYYLEAKTARRTVCLNKETLHSRRRQEH